MNQWTRGRRIAAWVAVWVAIALPAGMARAARYAPEDAASQVVVEGTSTLHDWRASGAAAGSLLMPEGAVASLWQTPPGTPVAATVRVEVPVASLISGKAGLDEKLREALRAETHPVITYALTVVRLTQLRDATHAAVEAEGRLTVAGVERPVTFPAEVELLPDGSAQITGQTALRMTDFGIRPPKAMLGAIRAGDDVQIRWTWMVRPIDE